jgi:hypothetical protein
MSLCVKEKNATSAPDSTKERKISSINTIINNEVLWALTANN